MDSESDANDTNDTNHWLVWAKACSLAVLYVYENIYIYILYAKLKVPTDVWSALPEKIMIIYNLMYIVFLHIKRPLQVRRRVTLMMDLQLFV